MRENRFGSISIRGLGTFRTQDAGGLAPPNPNQERLAKILNIESTENPLESNLVILSHDAERLEKAAKQAGAAYEAMRQEMFQLAKERNRMQSEAFKLQGAASDAAWQNYLDISRKHQRLLDALPGIERNLANLREAAYAARKLVASFAELPDELRPRRGLAGAAMSHTA